MPQSVKVMLDDNEWLMSGQQDMTASIPVTVASDQFMVDSTDTNFCGQFTVAAGSTVTQGPNVTSKNGFFIRANPFLSSSFWVSVHSSGSANSYPISTGESPLFIGVTNLNKLDFIGQALATGSMCWIKPEG
jgi:hypothetical protein